MSNLSENEIIKMNMTDEEIKMKSEIKFLLDAYSTDVGLDFAIRALENYFDAEREKKNKHSNVRSELSHFQIIKIPSKALSGNISKLLVSKNIATIHYPESADPLTRRILIAHELGHLYLHYKEGDSNSLVIEPEKEKEATLFAKQLLGGRCDFYDSADFKNAYQITWNKLYKTIDSIFEEKKNETETDLKRP